MKRSVVVLMTVLVFFCVVKIAVAEEIEGTIRAVAHCNPQEKKSEIKFFIDTGQEMIPLKEAPPAKVGQKILMKGDWTEKKNGKKKEFICRTVSQMKIKEIQTETSDTTREIKYLILLLKFSDTTTSDPDDWGTAKAEGRFLNDSDSAKAFYHE